MSASTDLGPTPTPTGPASSALRRLRAFRRNRDGMVAVEFGLVSIPFFALLFAILETALVFWSTQILETAVANAARTIYTGQFQQTNDQTAADIALTFKQKVCDQIPALFVCDRNSDFLHVDVRVFTPGQTVPDPVVNGQVDPTAFGYQVTKANDIVLVRAALEYPVFVSTLNLNLANLANGKRLIMATATFRNEPF